MSETSIRLVVVAGIAVLTAAVYYRGLRQLRADRREFEARMLAFRAREVHYCRVSDRAEMTRSPLSGLGAEVVRPRVRSWRSPVGS